MGEFGALMNKNWIIYKRNCCGNILQIILPVMFLLIVLFFSKISPPQYIPEQSFLSNSKYHITFNSSIINTLAKNCPSTSTIALAPSSSNIVNKLQAIFTANSMTSQLYTSQSQIQDLIRSSIYSSSTQICWAIIIQSQSAKYQYKLRFNTSEVGLNNIGPQTSAPPLTLDTGIDLNSYQTAVSSGMMGVNYLISNIIFQIQAGLTKYLEVQSSPAYQQYLIKDTIYQNLYRWIDLIFLLPLLIVYIRQTFFMLGQKQEKVRQSMRIMGMRMKSYYFTWFIRYFIIYCIIHSAAVTIMVFQLPYVPFYIPLALFFLFDGLIIIQNFFIQVFFSRKRLGILMALLFFLLQYAACYVVSNTNPQERFKTFLSIVPHVAFVFAFQNLFYFQSQKITASLFQSINSYTLITALASFTANIIFYLILLWYFDQIIPNQWGTSKNLCFCFWKKSHPKKEHQKFNRKLMDYHLKIGQNTLEQIQMVSSQKHLFVVNEDQIRDNNKIFLKLYKNEVFVLYGHNGSGKTTVISTLSGIIDPKNGWLSVFGSDDIDEIQRGLGYCSQQNILNEEMTVKEHLDLFANLKELQLREGFIHQILSDFNLNSKSDTFIRDLAQWQKRKLSIAISFVGKSKFIILDEPTFGMDPITKKQIWRIIHSYKKDKIIIVTSHLIDQADSFADRVGIIKQGKLLCCGSTTFLKEKFGLGYKVTFVKSDRRKKATNIIKMIKKVIPNALVLSDVAFQLSIQLPLRQFKYYSDLFNEIDSKRNVLGIESYGINMASLQQVFFAVGSQQAFNSDEEQLTYVEKHEGWCNRFFLHFRANFIKKIKVLKRDSKKLILQLLLPICIIIGTCYFIRSNYINDIPLQTINTQAYLTEQNPFRFPISSSDAVLLNNIKTSLITQYGSQMLIYNYTDTTAANFDQINLFPLKKTIKTLKGGIFFDAPSTVGANTKYYFSALCITKSPTSYFFLPSLATQALINSQFAKSISITVVNHPLPFTYDQRSLGSVISGFLGAFLFSLAFAFMFSSLISSIVRQRQERVRFLQMINGMLISAYWTANLVFDLLAYSLVAATAVFFCFYLNIPFLSGNIQLITIGLFLFFGITYLPFTYIFGFLYKSNGSAQSVYFLLTLFMGGLLPGLTFALRFISSEYNWIGRLIAWILRLHPEFAFGEIIVNLSSVNIYKKFQNNSKAIQPFSSQISIAPLGYLIVGFIAYLCILILIQKSEKRYLYCQCSTQNDPPFAEKKSQIKEKDVVRQQTIALKSKVQRFSIIARQLTKIYPGQNMPTVENVSLALQKGQFFGLLGTKSSGKSTIFKILQGQISSTYGSVFLCGKQVNQTNARGKVGYCPQFDTFVEGLTVREQLQYFYSIKSLRQQLKEQCINNIISIIGLKDYEHNISSTLSRGNKRKLSIAIAIMDQSSVILLDQPSNGMDPVGKTFMWRTLSKVIDNNQSTIIFTTNSLEQAEALSSRIAIMHQGSLKCIGNSQEIKRKYGDGIEVQIRLKPYQIDQKINENKKIENLPIGSQGQLQNVLKQLHATQHQKQQISEIGMGKHIYEMLTKGELYLYAVFEYLHTSYVFNEITQYFRQQFKQVEILSQLHNGLKLKINIKPKLSDLFIKCQSIKEYFGIEQYNFKQISVERIIQRIADHHIMI